jgi:MFS family permease
LTVASPEGDRPRHDPLGILRQRNFDLFLGSRVLSGVASTMLQAVFLWHVHEISESALSLGLLGLARFFPALGLSLIGGAAADAYNRRLIIIGAQIAPLFCGIALAVATFGDWITLEMIFALAFAVGLAQAFESPANSALLPSIVAPEDFPHAVNVSSTARSLGAVVGPALGGLVIAAAGVGEAYVAYAVCLSVSISMMVALHYEQKAGPKKAVSLAAIREGVQYVRTRPVLVGAMTLDLFAVVFAGATALLPIYANEILHTGAVGYGLLLGSYEAGAFLMAFIMVMRPPVARTGRTLVWAVIAFGALTIVFGLSRWLPLSIAAYLLIGAADQVSVVMRHAIIQLSTPDELRGRVSAVSSVFIQSSNQLGAVESGFVAALTSATFAVVSGGAAAMGIAGLVGYRIRDLYNYTLPRRKAPGEQAEREPEAAAAAG